MDVPVATPTAAPIEATALPSPSPITDALDPTQEPLPETSERIPISIDNVKELTIQTQLKSELANIHAAFDLSVDGQYIALSNWYVPENVVRIWDLEQGSFIESLTFQTKDVVAVAFSQIGTVLASGSQDGMVALWEVGTWEMIDSFLGYAEGVSSLAFSPDGSMLAVGGYRNQLSVWRLEDGERLHYYDGPGPHVVNKVTFTNDGREYYGDTGYADVTAGALPMESSFVLSEVKPASAGLTFPQTKPCWRIPPHAQLRMSPMTHLPPSQSGM